LVIELPPLVGSNKQAFQPRVNALNKYIRESFNFVDLSPLDSEWVARYSSPDNLHLSKEGSEKIAELIVETLARPEPNSGVVLPPIIYLLLLDQS
jgi:lysophospholipase L1-like esterase